MYETSYKTVVRPTKLHAIEAAAKTTNWIERQIEVAEVKIHR